MEIDLGLRIPEEVRQKGVSRPSLWKIKKKIGEGKSVNFKTRAIKKLV